MVLAVDAIRDAIVEVDELHSRPTLVRSRWQLQMWRDVHEQWSRKLTEITSRKEQADAALGELRTALEGQGEDAVAVGRLAQQASQTTAGLLKVQKHDIIRVLQAPRAQWVATEIYNVPTWTKYGDTGTEEWYAETYARFVLDPDQMRQDNPAFFDWFKSQLEQDPIHTTPNLDNLALLPPIADLPSPDDADQPPIQN